MYLRGRRKGRLFLHVRHDCEWGLDVSFQVGLAGLLRPRPAQYKPSLDLLTNGGEMTLKFALYFQSLGSGELPYPVVYPTSERSFTNAERRNDGPRNLGIRDIFD